MLNHCLAMLGILTRILTRIPENAATNLNEFLLKTKNFLEIFIPFL